MFESFNEVQVAHLSFLIAGISQPLLFGKSLCLIDRIIQFAIAVSELATGYNDVEPLG